MLYSIDFEGHYPVGAVAIVEADNEADAIEIFRLKLSEEEPHLFTKETNHPSYINPVEISLEDEGGCIILTNGSY